MARRDCPRTRNISRDISRDVPAKPQRRSAETAYAPRATMKVILFGATNMVGQGVLRQCPGIVSNAHYVKILG